MYVTRRLDTVELSKLSPRSAHILPDRKNVQDNLSGITGRLQIFSILIESTGNPARGYK